jgi:conjugative relaxase-like TrwC/TraI family protein
MLLSYEVTSASRAKDYFATSVSPEAIASRQDYYSEGQESPGTYGGKLADVLGLAGKPVDEATFHRLCDNRHPTLDKPLTPRTNDHRRVCYDFTISGPKSFSIIEAFARPEERGRLRQAFDDAVAEMVAEDMEPDMQTRERAKGADHNITTGNILTVSFDHATARPENDDTLPDPHWHKHLLVWNATRRPDDGKIKAGQFGDIIRDKPYYRAAFYARLADKLEDLGYAIDRRGGTQWEIAGVPQTVIDKFSKRTMQIEAEAEKRGITDAAQKAELGAKIRSNKQKDQTLSELRSAWDAQLDQGERAALARVYAGEIPPGQEVTAAEAVAWAIAHVSEKLSVFPEREIKRVALLHGLGSVTPDQVAAELPRQGVVTSEIDGRWMATTEGLQREEDYLVGQAAGGRGSVAAVGVAEGLTRTMKDGKSLNDGQWDAVTGLLTSENRINLVEGPAGAGKSSLLGKYQDGMRLAGKDVHFFATTAAAVEVLHKDGFKGTKTVAHLLLDERLQASIKGSRVVVDETSLLGHKDAVALFRLAEKLDLKLTFVGDPMQHGSIARGALMRILKDYGGIKPFRLTEILRQENPAYLQAAKLLSEGKTLEGFNAIDAMGRIVEIAEPEDRYRHIAVDYWQALDDKKSVLVVSPTHAEAGHITAAIRSVLRDTGKLGAEDRQFTRLVAVDTSEAERGLATTYRPGDVIQFHQNAKGGFKKGDRLTIMDASALPLSEAAHFSVYRTESISLTERDRIRFTGNVKTLDGKHTLKNGMARMVAGFTPKGIKLDNGWVIPADAGHFRHGFVETSFGSQGRTVQRVILGMAAASAPAMNMEQLYVSASRAKQSIRVYTDSKAEIRDAVKRSSQKLAALDLRPKPPAAPTKSRGMHDHTARRRRLSVIEWMRAAWNRQAPHVSRPVKTHMQNDRMAGQERNGGHER